MFTPERTLGLLVALGMFLFSVFIYFNTGDWVAGIFALGSLMYFVFFPPKISLVSFKSLPTQGSAPRFEIKLRVMNPNKQTLDIAGISYSVELLGKELVTGVASLPEPVDCKRRRQGLLRPARS